MSEQSTFVLLFCVATAVALATRWIRIPYTVALVAAGLVLGNLRIFEPPALTKELLFTLFLPGLLFEAAYHLHAGELRKNIVTVAALAVPGVVAAIVLTATLTTAVLHSVGLDPTFTRQYGLVFGALIAATDPIAVVALFRSSHTPPRLAVLIEGESLLNDGTSIVLLTLILGVVAGVAPSAGSLATSFATVTAGGALVGGVIGTGASLIITRVDDAMIEITLTVIAAYGAFVLGERFGVSGVIATVVAGLICGSYGRRVGMTPTTRAAVATFWEYVAFALNSIVFLLLGFTVHFSRLSASWAEIVIAFLAVLATRAGVILVVVVLLRRTQERLPLAWSAVLTWGGLRGALSMVLALGLPRALPHRDLLLTMTTGVVLLSIVVQGLSMPLLLRRLGLTQRRDALLAHDLARGELQASAAALSEIDRLAATHAAPPAMLRAVRERYAARHARAAGRLESLQVEQGELQREDAARIVRHLLLFEQDRLTESLHQGLLLPKTYARLAEDVVARLDRLDSDEFDDPTELLPEPAPGTE